MKGGSVSGIDHDTASFAVNAIRRWWQRMGRSAYPHARTLVITADAGGSNGTRLRLWKWELQRFADHRPHDHRLSFPARHQQVEQDRTSTLFAHRDELARHSTREPRDDRELDGV
jgi:hypothetical protein